MIIVTHFMVEKEQGLLSTMPKNGIQAIQALGLANTTGKRYGAACGAPVGTFDGKHQHMGSGEAWATTCPECQKTKEWQDIPDTGPFKKAVIDVPE